MLFRLLLLAAAVLTGCDSPCRALARRICECELNTRERIACLLEIDSNGNVRQPTQPEEEQCSELLDTCTCAAVEREDFVACGLTKRRDPAR